MSRSQSPAEEPAHDVLAAEAFAVPASDPDLHHGPLVVPEDPNGIEEPHDVLAAEEFPMPALHPHPAVALVQRRGGPWRFGLEALALLALGAFVLRILRRRRGTRPRSE